MGAKKLSEDKMKLLCVNDIASEIDLIESELCEQYDVVRELSGAAAVGVVQKEKPDIILLDLNMPNVNGHEVLINLKKNPATGSIPIIFLTGVGVDSDRIKVLHRDGAAGCIHKPINRETLLDDVNNILHDLNIQMISDDGLRKSYVGFNAKEKYHKLEEDVGLSVELDKKVLIISPNSGEIFFKNADSLFPHLESEMITFLRVKSTFVSRIPYMDNLAPVELEFRKFLKDDLNEYFVVIDEPQNIFDYQGTARSLSSAYAFNDLIDKRFGSVGFYFKRAINETQQENILQLAHMFVGG